MVVRRPAGPRVVSLGAMTERLVVVGGDASGASAASQAKRANPDGLDVVMLERGEWTSYSACGIPYWIAGDVTGPDELVARSPEEHRRAGIDVRMGTEATEIDLDARVVVARDGEGRTERLGFDHLVIGTGATPVRPNLPGVDHAGIYGVQTIRDGAAVIDRLAAMDADRRTLEQAVVVGAGYIGVEMAEAMKRRGMEVTMLDQAPEPMTTLDPDMGCLVRKAMEGFGVRVLGGQSVDGFDADDRGWVRSVSASGTSYDADIVILGLGARPETTLAAEAGVDLGSSGGIRTDLRMAVTGQDQVFAVGDCVESYDRVSRSWVHVPLGTHANKQGRVAGINIGGGYATFPGIVGTAVSKVCDLEIARTGLAMAAADRAGFRYEVVTVESTTRAGYLPDPQPMTVKMLAELGAGRLLGAQIVGREGSAKRIDTCALALWNEMTVDELMQTDLSYAPPFSPVWDPVQTAARAVAAKLR